MEPGKGNGGWALKPLGWTLTVCLTVLTAPVSALLFAALLYGLPRLAYHAFRPTAAAECAQIRPGMTLQEVQAIINKKIPPRYLDYRANRLVSAREFGASCVVEFDPTSKLAVRVLVKSHEPDFPDL